MKNENKKSSNSSTMGGYIYIGGILSAYIITQVFNAAINYGATQEREKLKSQVEPVKTNIEQMISDSTSRGPVHKI